MPGLIEEDLLTMAAIVEQNRKILSRRPSSPAPEKRGVKPGTETDFQSTTGAGVSGRVNERRVLVGKPAFLRAHGITDLATLETKAVELQREGQTVIFVAIDGRAAGVIAVADPIKQSTPAAIDHLHQLGIRIVMLTGDNERTARTVGGKLGIDEIEGGLSRNISTSGPAIALKEIRSSPWPAMESTTRRPCCREMLASRWGPARMSRWRAPASLCSGDLSGIEKPFA
jgi:Cu+-exporting ATPase